MQQKLYTIAFAGLALAVVLPDVAHALGDSCDGFSGDITALYSSGIFLNAEQSPIKNTQIFDFDMTHEGDFSMAFWMIIHSAPENGFESVFHKGASDLQRGPAVYLYEDVTDKDLTTHGIHISTSTINNQNPWTDLGFVPGLDIQEGTWYHIALTYENNGLGGSIETVYVDGNIEITNNRDSPTDATLSGNDVPFYFSDPYYDAADVSLKNLVFSPTALSEAEVKDLLCGTEGDTFVPAPQQDVGNPGARGDPHFKTWTGGRYDFQGACDLVLLQNPDFREGLGMDIHIRTKFTKQWSYISSAVLRIGDETLEVVGGQNVVENFWINKVAMGDLSKGISGFKIHYKEASIKQREFVVDLGSNDGQISIKCYKDFVRVDIEDGKNGSFANSRGLMGAYGTGETLGRDQKLIADTNVFGSEWQVQASEAKLFHNVEGVQAPTTCAMPSSTAARRRLFENPITLEDAELACSRVGESAFDDCVFDVLATNDKDIAGAY